MARGGGESRTTAVHLTRVHRKKNERMHSIDITSLRTPAVMTTPTGRRNSQEEMCKKTREKEINNKKSQRTHTCLRVKRHQTTT